MTKIVDLFGNKKEPKYIEFVYWLSPRGKAYNADLEPSDWDNLALFSVPKTKADGELDVILAWDNEDHSGNRIYLGHWNDGIVEE